MGWDFLASRYRPESWAAFSDLLQDGPGAVRDALIGVSDVDGVDDDQLFFFHGMLFLERFALDRTFLGRSLSVDSFAQVSGPVASIFGALLPEPALTPDPPEEIETTYYRWEPDGVRRAAELARERGVPALSPVDLDGVMAYSRLHARGPDGRPVPIRIDGDDEKISAMGLSEEQVRELLRSDETGSARGWAASPVSVRLLLGYARGADHEGLAILFHHE